MLVYNTSNFLNDPRIPTYIPTLTLTHIHLYPSKLQYTVILWTWTCKEWLRFETALYQPRPSIKRIDVDFLVGQSFHGVAYSDYRRVWVKISIDTFKNRIASYWKFNTHLLNDINFQDQLLLM